MNFGFPASRRATLWLVVAVGASCADPSDSIFEPVPVAPVEVAPGIFRVTFNPGPDVARGFTASGAEVLYRSRGLAGFGAQWRILSVPVEGGRVSEQAALYRAALIDSVGSLIVRANDRLLTVWKRSVAPAAGCGDPCPSPLTVWLFSILRLASSDGAPLSSLSARVVVTPTVKGGGAGSTAVRIRITPAELEVRTLGTNPFGPAMVDDSPVGYYSDGDAVWRFDAALPDAPPDSIGPGAYPAVSRGGALLAFSVATGLDSTSNLCRVQTAFFECVETRYTITNQGWLTVVMDAGTRDTIRTVAGAEPAFDPSQPRLLVRRRTGLVWVSLPDGAETAIPGTSGASSVAVSPDGGFIAFSRKTELDQDLFLVPLRPRAR